MTDKKEADDPICLLTRPAHQAAQISGWLDQAGFKVVNFPSIEIVPSTGNDFLQSLHQHIVEFDIALFVSRNAVDYAFRYLDSASLPPNLEFGVIGRCRLDCIRRYREKHEQQNGESTNARIRL